MAAATEPSASSHARGYFYPPDSSSPGRLPLAIPYLPIVVAAGVVTAIFALVYHLSGGAKFPNDDAYIALHNAQTLWAGKDSSYRGVSALVGATSGVELALLMLFETFISPAPLALFILCGVVTFAYVLGVYFLCSNSGFSRPLATVFAIASLLVAGSLFQFLNGLDTGLAMMAIVWNLALLASKRYASALAVICGLMPFVRPELAVLSVGSMLAMLIGAGKTRREKALAVALAIGAGLPFLVWYWFDTGGLIPSTIDAKSYFFAQANLPIAIKLNLLAGGVVTGLEYVFPIFLCVALVRSKPIRALCLSFVAIVLCAYLQELPGAWQANSGRYFFIFVPVVVFGVIDASSVSAPARRRFVRSCVVAAIVTTTYASVQQYQSYKYYLTVYWPSMVETVAWANAHIPPGAMVMVHDAGYVAYAGDFHLVDFTGLKTPQCVVINREVTFPSNGAKRPQAIAMIADLFRPQYLIAVKSWSEYYRLAGSLRRDGWRVTKIFESRKAPRDAEIYEIFALHKNWPTFACASPDARRGSPGRKKRAEQIVPPVKVARN